MQTSALATCDLLLNLLRDVAQRDDLSASLPLSECGVDSLEAIEWVYIVEDELGLILADDDSFFDGLGDLSVEDIAHQVERASARQRQGRTP